MVLLYLRREMGEEYVPYGAALYLRREMGEEYVPYGAALS